MEIREYDEAILFSDRQQAAELLAQKLARFKGQNPLILGIPRGSVPMAKSVADRLQGELDVVLVHKIGAPDNPEFAIGSVSEFGSIYLSPELGYYGIAPLSVEALAKREIEKLKARRRTYSPVRPPANPAGRIVVIVDDGIATGNTMLAAIRAIRGQNPACIIAASPVASDTAIELLAPEADELVILKAPRNFFSISQFYENFPQVSDEEVIQTLKLSSRSHFFEQKQVS